MAARGAKRFPNLPDCTRGPVITAGRGSAWIVDVVSGPLLEGKTS